MIPGSRLRLGIDDVAFGGEGVARVQDFVVFIPFVIPGEVVEAEITEVKKRFARARLLRIIEPSPLRVLPGCKYFGDCGGCQYQHLEYEAQLRIKHKQITDLLARVGGLAGVPVDRVMPCSRPYGYRNRIMVRSQWDKFKQGLNIGFIRHDNRLVVDVEECPICEPAVNDQLRQVRAHPPPKGGLKVVLRLAPRDWEVPPDSFFQNNFFLLPQLVAAVRDRIASSGVRRALDLYCGVGFFGLEVANLVDELVGVELDHRAVRAAEANARNRGCPNGRFVTGRAEDLLPGLLKERSATRTAVILDPPRTGCPRESLELLRRLSVAQIVYVSCHPATLARDLAILIEGGAYRLERLTPFDMFPQTQHVECVADLRWADGLEPESRSA